MNALAPLSRRRWLMATAALGLAACGGGTDTTKARVRLVNASRGYEALDFVVDDDRVQASVPYGGAEGYVEVDPDRTASSIRRPGSPSALLTFTPSLGEDRDYTVLAWGDEGELRSVVLDDNTEDADDGKVRLRVLNAAADAGALDVYVTAASDPFTDAVPVQEGAAAGALGSYVSIDRGTWVVTVTAADSKTDVRLQVPALTLDNRACLTLVLTPGDGGVLVGALLVRERGGIARADNTQARLRVAACTPLGATVTASAGGVLLVNGGASLTVGAYRRVDAGAPELSVLVDGVAATGPAADFAAGGDYTLLVYGEAGARRYTLLADDNRAPDVTGQAKLRLVHAVADLDGTLSLSADFEPVADGVARGQASGYVGLNAVTGMTLTSSTPGRETAVTSDTDENLVAGSVYTYFVMGTLDAAVGLLRQDR